MDAKLKQVIQMAAARMKGRGVLTGTAALWLRGYDVEPGDVDFLVDVPQRHAVQSPVDAALAQDDLGLGSTQGSFRTTIDGVKVDYIYADEQRRPFMTPRPDLIDGVPVASVEDILGIKAFAGRYKDRDFLVAWHTGKIKYRA